MSTRRSRVTKTRPLEILGVGQAEERAYRWLLRHSGATASETAQALALTASKAQRLLDAIEVKGLATRSPERPRRYIPASPNIGLEALILRRQNDLQRAQSTARKLQEEMEAAKPRHKQEQIVELISSREAEHRIYDQMHRSAKFEVLTLMRPPMLISRLDVPFEQGQRYQREAQSRGVHYRSVADTDFMAMHGAMQGVREDMEAGEEVRVISRLPFKMVLTDRRAAFVPLYLKKPGSPSLLVRSSALLDALYELFEVFWARAAPASFTQGGAWETGSLDSHLPKEAADLITLMTAGLNDKKIVDELGISLSTLTRRISELMRFFNARSRFQLGCLITLYLAAHGSGRSYLEQKG